MYGTAMMGLLGGGIGILTRSLNFGSGNNRSLSISQANFDYTSLNKDTVAFAGSFYMASFGTGKNIFQKSVGAASEFDVTVQSNGAVSFFAYSGTPGSPWFLTTAAAAATAGAWNAYLVYFDRTNGTPNNRIRIWVNGTEQTDRTNYTAPSGSLATSGGTVVYGYDGSQEIDGLLYSPAVFSNYLPTTSEIFDGTSGGVKNFTPITGLHSLLDTLGGVVTHDNVLAAPWTNNNGVTASVALP